MELPNDPSNPHNPPTKEVPMTQPRPSLSEKAAAVAYARAHNTHDLDDLAQLVHNRVRVYDQRQ